MSLATRPGRVLVICATVACAMAAVAVPVRAATVRVGAKFNGAPVSGHVVCGNKAGCTVSQQGASYTSPVTGVIVDWRLKGAVGTFALRVLNGNTGGTAFPFGTAPSGSGEVSTFAAEEPIAAGERIGVDVPNISGTELGYTANGAATYSFWAPALAPGETKAPKNEEPNELLLQVDIQPAPGITAVTPASGPVLLPDPVTITGHDFEEVRSVEVGGQFAAYEVLSETTILAEPVGFTPGTVPVTVTTRAGSATLPAAFSFEPGAATKPPGGSSTTPEIPPVVIPPEPDLPEKPECHVPKLKGRTLRAVKRALAGSHCQLGSVTKRKGVTAAKGKVVGQVPPPGARAADRAHVQIRLG